MIYIVSVKSMSGVELFDPKIYSRLADAVICAEDWVILNYPTVEITVTDQRGELNHRKIVLTSSV